MSDTRALLNVASFSQSSNEHDLLSLTSLSTALLNYSGSDYPTRYSGSALSYSPPHLRESNSLLTSSQAHYLYLPPSSFYLPPPTLLVNNPSPPSKSSPSYNADNLFSYPSPLSETTIVDPSYLAQGQESVYPSPMSRASATTISQPPLATLTTLTTLRRPGTPIHYSTKPVPKRRKKYACCICSQAFSCNAHLVRHIRKHTGEKNHKCPYPGCEARCSRADNLQQHFRSHFISRSRWQTVEAAVIHARLTGLMGNMVHDNNKWWDP